MLFLFFSRATSKTCQEWLAKEGFTNEQNLQAEVWACLRQIVHKWRRQKNTLEDSFGLPLGVVVIGRNSCEPASHGRRELLHQPCIWGASIEVEFPTKHCGDR